MSMRLSRSIVGEAEAAAVHRVICEDGYLGIGSEVQRFEAEVAAYLLAGRTTSFAAEKLFIAESTVRAHVHSIYRKCDVHSRMELMDAFDAFWMEEQSDMTAMGSMRQSL